MVRFPAVATPGLGGQPVLVVHRTGADLNTSYGQFTDGKSGRRTAKSDVGIHYLIARDGHIFKFIDDRWGANHAGPGVWRRHDNVNERSVGIELVNVGTQTFPAAQMNALFGLVAAILQAFDVIHPDRVVGHGEININDAATILVEKTFSDPGREFNWKELEQRKLTFVPNQDSPATVFGIQPGKNGVKVSNVPDKLAFKRALAKIGYSVTEDNDIPRDNDQDTAANNAYGAFLLRVMPKNKRPAGPSNVRVTFDGALELHRRANNIS